MLLCSGLKITSMWSHRGCSVLIKLMLFDSVQDQLHFSLFCISFHHLKLVCGNKQYVLVLNPWHTQPDLEGKYEKLNLASFFLATIWNENWKELGLVDSNRLKKKAHRWKCCPGTIWVIIFFTVHIPNEFLDIFVDHGLLIVFKKTDCICSWICWLFTCAPFM